MSRLGFGWMGSKNGIARELVDLLPAGECFVDLFAGGCAMTHAAMLSGKYKRFIANDVKGTAVFFKQAIEGKVENLYEPINHEEFFAYRDHSVKIASVWSFGNNGRSYLWGKCENIKLAAFKMLTLPTVEERYTAYKEFVGELGRKGDTAGVGQLESIARLQGIKRLEQLDADALTVCAEDYRQVPIPDGAVVYADPPYAGVEDYGTDFDTGAFWDWARTRGFPVFVSEYTGSEGFTEIWQRQKTCKLSAANNALKTTERLFVQARYADAFMKQEVQQQPELLEATA